MIIVQHLYLPFDQQNHILIDRIDRRRPGKQPLLIDDVIPCFGKICAFDGQKWLRVTCTLVRDERLEAKTHMLDNYPMLKKMYDAADDNTEVLYLKDATATFSSFTEAPKTIKF